MNDPLVYVARIGASIRPRIKFQFELKIRTVRSCRLVNDSRDGPEFSHRYFAAPREKRGSIDEVRFKQESSAGLAVMREMMSILAEATAGNGAQRHVTDCKP